MSLPDIFISMVFKRTVREKYKNEGSRHCTEVPSKRIFTHQGDQLSGVKNTPGG
jgi:hypothetical protein